MLEKKINVKSALIILGLIAFLISSFGYLAQQVLGHNQYNLSSRMDSELPQILTTISSEPQNVQARIKLGLLYIQRKEWKKGLEQLLIAEKQDKDNLILLYQIGYAYGQSAQWELAEKYFLAVIARDERFGPALFSLGQLAQNKGDFSNALQYYLKAEEVDPKPPYAKAIDDLNKILGQPEQKPTNQERR